MIDEAIEELTRLLIQQDFEDKKNKKEEILCIKKKDLFKICIKMLKIIK